MDQAKWCIPRCRGHVTTKAMAKYDRPKMKIEGVWCHNVLMTLHCIDCRQAGDASMVIECLCRDLEKVVQICRDKGKAPPKKIFLWATLMAMSVSSESAHSILFLHLFFSPV